MTAPTAYEVTGSYPDFWDHPIAFCEAYGAWLEAHGINPNATWRTEHHVIDAPFVRVFQYDADEHGNRYVDLATGDIAVREPFDVLIKTPPPNPEDYA